MDHPSLPFARLSARELRRFAVEAVRRHADLRDLIPDPDARFSQALVRAFPPGATPQPVDLREALGRALDTSDDLQRLWALTDLVAALTAGFDPDSQAAEGSAEIGAEIAGFVHENAHVVADSDTDLLDTRWVDVVYAAWSRGWPWAEELADALTHAVEGDQELSDHLVLLAESDATKAREPDAAARYATVSLCARIAAGQMEEARHLVRRYGLGVAYSAMLTTAGRVPEILVQHAMLLEERHEYATVAMGLALAGYAAEARALAEAGRAWGTGDEAPIDEALAQIPEPLQRPGDIPPAQGPGWDEANSVGDNPVDVAIDRAYSALEDERVAEAVALLLERHVGFLEPNFCAWVAARAEAAGVQAEDVAALLQSAAEGEIQRANRRAYNRAVTHLHSIRRLLESRGKRNDWVRLLDSLRHEHSRKSALLETLQPLLSEAGLS